ncbi:MAG: hypothetical protein ACRDZY_12405 [Acidimicrobiales bacterium]
MRARVSSALPATADVPLPATADVPLLAVVTVRTASWDTPRDVAAYIQQLIEGSLARLEDTITCATVTHQPPDV